MSKVITVNHSKGQKHSGKSNWSKVIAKKSPEIDEENPELAKNPKIKFKKLTSDCGKKSIPATQI